MKNVSMKNQKALTGPQLPKIMTQTLASEHFFHLFNKTLDKHAPLKQGIRKDKKIKQKPCVTKGIETSIKRTDKLYKEAFKEKDSQKKIQQHETYRKYRNKIVDLLKVSKQTHYQI